MFKKTYRNKKKTHTDGKFRVISCTTVTTDVKTQIADTYAQLGGCCSSSVGVNKTLTHFPSRPLTLTLIGVSSACCRSSWPRHWRCSSTSTWRTTSSPNCRPTSARSVDFAVLTCRTTTSTRFPPNAWTSWRPSRFGRSRGTKVGRQWMTQRNKSALFISILVVSNHNSFRVPYDKILVVVVTFFSHNFVNCKATLMKTFIHRKYGRYRQDTDMYKRQKQNNNTQYTLQHGSG